MELARLAALEIIVQYDQADYDWECIAENFAGTYLGEHDHLVGKLAERYGVPIAEVAKNFPRTLFQQRHKRFGLESPNSMHAGLKRWFLKNKKDLSKYRMYAVYGGVVEQLKEAF